ncbi:sigma-70 family RNA polymerase sigma factor [Marinomonas ostreistagni]|uniref:RNA polymerase sigma factor n=1 Tax=Marinomonas ostreistagni TaxID=359209 RepID=A0ABS0Z8I0_9GAMM|nr:sigma-70 family RNA polymerase sigma factor [Marinomonas ostreistagni]MBJ7549959.1 sigma-70 family RNA polymerase sigma factor [Marinomonas ostreistagni]
MHDVSRVEQLLEEIAQGQKLSLSELYECTSAKLYGICLRVLEDESLAQDVLQETYIKIWRNANQYQVNGLSPMTWLITIARNSAIDRKRSLASKFAESIDDYELESDESSPEAVTHSHEISRQIEECLGTLESERADAVKGAYLEGLSYADLAEKFSVPLNTMRTWLRRSLQKLKGCMSQ